MRKCPEAEMLPNQMGSITFLLFIQGLHIWRIRENEIPALIPTIFLSPSLTLCYNRYSSYRRNSLRKGYHICGLQITGKIMK